MKKIPHWSLLFAFILSKIESTIEHLLSWARHKSTRSYHKTMSLDTTPHIIVRKHSHFGSPLFILFSDMSSLDPSNTKSVYLPQVFPIYSYIPGITAMIPFP